MADVGLYSLAYKFGMFVGYVQVPFESYWEAQVFHVVRNPGGERHFVRALTYYSVALFGGALFVSLARCRSFVWLRNRSIYRPPSWFRWSLSLMRFAARETISGAFLPSANNRFAMSSSLLRG